MRVVLEERLPGELPLWRHPEWARRFPWLVQGTTGVGPAEDPFDLGLFGSTPVGAALERWRRLREATGVGAALHSRQLHGVEVRAHRGAAPEGLLVLDGYDGHLTEEPDLLLTVSVADCVPVSLVASTGARAIAIVHAGWRGVAGGIVERAIARLGELCGAPPAELWLHCGPAICGECYEVGPEVHLAVRPELPAPDTPTPIDLRGAIAARGVSAGLDAERVSVSGHCTRCGPGAFFSHRGASVQRQMGFLALRR